MNSGLFIPLEIVQREYLGKLLIAVEMANRGMPVIFGHKQEVLEFANSTNKPGILFYKSALKKNHKVFDSLVKKGFKIVAQDEETGITTEKFENFFKRRGNIKYADDLDGYFCFGDDDYAFLINNSLKKPNSIYKTGTTRSCFWGDYGRIFYEDKINKIQSKYNKYVLIVCNFGKVNHYLSVDELIKHSSKYQNWNEKSKTFWDEYEFQKRLMDLYLRTAKEITDKTDYNVVIRPHPSENKRRWIELTKSIKNVFIEYEGNITAWILASELIIQNGCTSGIEAAVSDVPVIALGEHREGLISQSTSFSNKCAINLYGDSKITDCLQNLNDIWNEIRIENQDRIKRKLHNPGTLEPIYDICDKLFEISGKPATYEKQNYGSDSPLYDLYNLYRMSKFRSKNKSVLMDQNKRPTIHKNRILKDVNQIKKILEIDRVIKINRINYNCFSIDIDPE